MINWLRRLFIRPRGTHYLVYKSWTFNDSAQGIRSWDYDIFMSSSILPKRSNTWEYRDPFFERDIASPTKLALVLI